MNLDHVFYIDIWDWSNGQSLYTKYHNMHLEKHGENAVKRCTNRSCRIRDRGRSVQRAIDTPSMGMGGPRYCKGYKKARDTYPHPKAKYCTFTDRVKRGISEEVAIVPFGRK